MDAEQLNRLQIRPEIKRRPQRAVWTIFAVIACLTLAAAYFAWPRASDRLPERLRAALHLSLIHI